jgi:hypothetical protein
LGTLAVVGTLAGFTIGPKVVVCYLSEEEATQMQAREYALSALPIWRRSHPGSPCPEHLGQLNEYTNRKTNRKTKDGVPDATDAWGQPFYLVCTPETTEVRSAGADGTFHTADDISSAR